VATKVLAGEFPSALEHYMGFGRHEGRHGFAVLRELEELSYKHPAMLDLFDELLSAARVTAVAEGQPAMAGGVAD
jgi:hypothetical protein